MRTKPSILQGRDRLDEHTQTHTHTHTYTHTYTRIYTHTHTHTRTHTYTYTHTYTHTHTHTHTLLHLHLFLNRRGHWGTTTSFLHFALFSTTLLDWRTPDLSIPRCSLPSSLSACLVFFPLSLCLVRWFWPDLMIKRQVHTLSLIHI